MVVKLFMSACCNAILAIGLYILDERTKFGKLEKRMKLLIIGALFGCMAIFSSTSFGGGEINGVIVNVRDSAPLCG